MTNNEFQELCVNTVRGYINMNRLANQNEKKFVTNDDIYIVWLSKTLQNNKALISTELHDGMYYELTYNGDKNELYLDAYKKVENACFKIEPE